MRKLVDIQAPALARGVAEASGHVLQTRFSIREPDDPEDDPPRSAWLRHVDLDAERKTRSRRVVRVAVAILVGRHPLAFVMVARRGQRLACSGKTLDVRLEERLVEMSRGMAPTTSAWADGSALVVRGEGRAVGALKLF